MGVRNCIECGKLCIETPSKLCPDCFAEEEKMEYKIGEYLREKGKATLEEIHRDTGIKERVIMRMLKNGRVFSKGLIGYPCEMCREAIIYEGRLCSQCGSGLMKQMEQSKEDREIAEREHQRTGLRMYTRDEVKNK